MKFKKIITCLDMKGCPNRCKHCWISCTPNGNLKVEDLKYVAEQFRPFSESLEVYDWYREPDYDDSYKEMWKICKELSDEHSEHFELISFWRLVRDENYIKWLSEIGLKTVQLTLFGDEQTTDRYIGRRGAYKEILSSIDILFENGICPRIQIFINKNNIDQLPFIEKLLKELDLEKRCKEIGGEFAVFMHQGSCEGENEKFYDQWITNDEIKKIPLQLEKLTLSYWGKEKIKDVLGQTEQSLYKELINDYSTKDLVSDTPVFYIDKDFNVYPNLSAPTSYWYLGNLKEDGVETVLNKYRNNKSIAQSISVSVPISEQVKKCGDRQSQKLFSKGDYINFILNQYCKQL